MNAEGQDDEGQDQDDDQLEADAAPVAAQAAAHAAVAAQTAAAQTAAAEIIARPIEPVQTAAVETVQAAAVEAVETAAAKPASEPVVTEPVAAASALGEFASTIRQQDHESAVSEGAAAVARAESHEASPAFQTAEPVQAPVTAVFAPAGVETAATQWAAPVESAAHVESVVPVESAAAHVESTVPVESAAPAIAPALIVPAASPAAPIIAAAEPVQASTLHGIVNAAGLTWVETDPARHAQTQERIAAGIVPVRLGRERKPVPPVSIAPLQQIETRR